jgi:hypothetical protein
MKVSVRLFVRLLLFFVRLPPFSAGLLQMTGASHSSIPNMLFVYTMKTSSDGALHLNFEVFVCNRNVWVVG